MADLSQYPIGSRWVDLDGDVVMVWAHSTDDLRLVYQNLTGEWRDYLHSPYENDTWLKPYIEPVTCPDFERYLVWDSNLNKSDGFSLQHSECESALKADFVFLAGVRDGEPFIEQVKP